MITARPQSVSTGHGAGGQCVLITASAVAAHQAPGSGSEGSSSRTEATAWSSITARSTDETTATEAPSSMHRSTCSSGLRHT
mmetsp:Transcript_35708/g.93680  ORF Transcript_35708/g.93680 Transcript_35708/m.93680 type:complete len:82 (-) Transcript_35708:121-366(-)